ncbi:MAG TPA: PAS domain-containing protein [Alphaproteobacteria bacterium]|nr:PAS domain-containing protein [Alphaproteobacteria bacterium]
MTLESERNSSSEEITFKLEELFFSRTDPAGIILSGNSVFQRVARYEWNELLRKPHKIIRHPDMPRALFWLLWDTIKKGEPIGAFVKNRAKDGRFYWVFAIVTPIEGGYLSVRLRPTSSVFAVVKQEYEKLVALEKRENLAPAESGKLLLARLAELGFANYTSFMAAALAAETQSRDEGLSRPHDESIVFYNDLVTAARTLLEHASSISTAYEQNQFVPFNFQVQAAQLGEDGASISIISDNYKMISTQIESQMSEFITSAQKVFDAINTGQFMFCTARIQKEMMRAFETEPETAGLSREAESKVLDQQQATYTNKAVAGLKSIAKQAKKFTQDCRGMSQLASGLEVTRIMGKVECARLSSFNDSLGELLNDLEVFQKTIDRGLSDIDQMNQQIQWKVNRLLAAAEAA